MSLIKSFPLSQLPFLAFSELSLTRLPRFYIDECILKKKDKQKFGHFLFSCLSVHFQTILFRLFENVFDLICEFRELLNWVCYFHFFSVFFGSKISDYSKLIYFNKIYYKLTCFSSAVSPLMPIYNFLSPAFSEGYCFRLSVVRGAWCVVPNF